MPPGTSGASLMWVNDRHVASVEVARTWPRRLRGLLGRSPLPDGLWLEPESGVHGVGMREPLDVALVDADGRVLEVVVLRPWRATAPRRGVRAVLEAPVGSFARWGVAPGAVLTLTDGPR